LAVDDDGGCELGVVAEDGVSDVKLPVLVLVLGEVASDLAPVDVSTDVD